MDAVRYNIWTKEETYGNSQKVALRNCLRIKVFLRKVENSVHDRKSNVF